MVQHGEFCIVDLDAAGWAMPVVVKALRSTVGDQMSLRSQVIIVMSLLQEYPDTVPFE